MGVKLKEEKVTIFRMPSICKAKTQNQVGTEKPTAERHYHGYGQVIRNKMKEPTEEQIKEFWKWCGLQTKHTFVAMGFGMKECSNCGALKDGFMKYCTSLLDVDLNSLFCHTVPKVIDKIMAEQECSSDLAYAILFKKWLQKLELDIPNHEGTLFQACWEVIHE